MNNVIDISKILIKSLMPDPKVVVDATVGNGNDSIFILDNYNNIEKLFCFDIQLQAIENSKLKICDILSKEAFESKVKMIHDSHENIDLYAESLDLIMFNLGYLPSFDKNIKTNCISTITAINKSLSLLNRGGLITIVCYPGHKEGYEEYCEIIKLTRTLDQKYFNVLENKFINQKNDPPILLLIYKR